MKIKFSKSMHLDQYDIDHLAKSINYPLPDSLKKFFIEFNGSVPEANVFTIDEKNESGINELIPVSKIIDELKYLDGVGSKVIPVAVAEGGNYVVIDLNNNATVYFWDHEEPQGLTKLASTIFDFLDKLVPFDPDNIELEDGQVESAWIDPDFLKNLKQ